MIGVSWLRRRRRSTVEQQIARAQALRQLGAELAVDELPVTQGLAQLHADVIASTALEAIDERTGQPVVYQPDVVLAPDPLEDRFETVHKLVQSMFWTGNAWAALAGSGDVVALRVLDPNTVSHEEDFDDRLLVTGWQVQGVPLAVDRMAHWKLNDDPRRGPLGRSPLQRCRSALEMYGWAYRYLRDYFAAGGNPGLVLRSNRILAPAVPATGDAPRVASEAEIAQQQWVEARQVAVPAVLDPQWSLEKGPDPQDLEQVIRVLEFGAIETCRLTGVAPSIANAMSSGSLTYSTTRDELVRWLVLSLGPTWLTRLEAGFTRLLAPGLVARFDRDSLIDSRLFATLAPNANPVEAAQRPPLRAVS